MTSFNRKSSCTIFPFSFLLASCSFSIINFFRFSKLAMTYPLSSRTFSYSLACGNSIRPLLKNRCPKVSDLVLFNPSNSADSHNTFLPCNIIKLCTGRIKCSLPSPQRIILGAGIFGNRPCRILMSIFPRSWPGCLCL